MDKRQEGLKLEHTVLVPITNTKCVEYGSVALDGNYVGLRIYDENDRSVNICNKCNRPYCNLQRLDIDERCKIVKYQISKCPHVTEKMKIYIGSIK